ncbi:rhomboid family intramembrane serine protease [Megalodesulfovibrio gigas]|uniref:Putative membrane protein n=1 Tax=Megalodesulfovibrio gigas (strain ATCC 19364 / DSM 1382 / NCIMB 9332 / VKM B-1759) TaxID=1121448 RepID=T2GE02_MEGG1|nr:rhomboid family intramembrane serine protease [Megalodesulfovibrio gigas]AGW14409.1 putative membrane protein [Megalodesulfovibrio gigas DSM 1382 = ATCC 19364]
MKLSWNAPGTLGLCAASLLVLGLQALLPAVAGVFASPVRVDPADPLFFAQCVLHVLGHVDFSHLSNNLLLLLLLGPMVEARHGTGWFLSIAALTAVVTALAALGLGHRVQGLSGVVFTCIGLASVAGARRGELPVTMLLVLGVYLGTEVLDLLRDDAVSQLSHLIGGVVGAGVGLALADREP